jgi:tRNA A-37 threonylcarbamoyl transferase component Bud32
MPEIVVRAKYNDLPQRWLLHFLRFTFPGWGVICPLGFILGIFIWVGVAVAYFNSMPQGVSIQQFINAICGVSPFIGYTLCLLVVPAACLSMMRTLSHNNLLLEKNGIVLPVETFQWRLQRFLPWSNISTIQVRKSKGADALPALTTVPAAAGNSGAGLPAATSGAGSEWRRRSIVLYRRDGGSVQMDLSKYESAEVEQILVAMETWGAGIEMDESVAELHTLLRAKQTEVAGLSYTDMWEDELRRRYNPTAFMPLDPGIVLHDGKLKVLRQLATGGLSAIYLTQLENQKLAVLKEAVLPENAIESVRAKASELFAREAQILSKLDHPNIVKVLDYFVEGGRNYMLMEYVPGQDLRQFIKQNGAQRETIVVDWGIQIVGIMKYLHELDPPIIHRDLTPDNLVLRDDGNIVLIDFGAANEFIAKGTGTFVGKQSFISPEQFRGKAVVQSDIYAFGCTLFYLLTGQEPEALDTSSPRHLDQKISQELDEAVQCCTALEVQDRYQSAAQLLPVLRKIAASLLGVV